MTVSLVTGAGRGIGRQVAIDLGARGHTVVVGARNDPAGASTAAAVRQAGGHALVVPLDIADAVSVAEAAGVVESRLGSLDVLVNNAAILYDSSQQASNADLALVREALETNLFGTWQVTLALLPFLRRSGHGRIVNVSSGAGALADMGANLPAYRISKVALNALTRMWAAELAQDGVLVNSVCPGWVATQMGGAGGRPIEDGAAGVVWAATLPDNGPTGGFFRDGTPIPW